MSYNYSQRDPRWADLPVGESKQSMAQIGCVTAACATMLSHYFNKEVLPSTLVQWLNENNGYTKEGLLYWTKVAEYSEKISTRAESFLRFSLSPEPKFGELTYGIRQVTYGNGHWVLDHPIKTGMVIDPWDGGDKEYSSFTYTNRNRYFLGQPQEYSVDSRYGLQRTWKSFMTEKKYRFHWVPNTPASYIYGKIKRRITDRETSGLVYGHWDFKAVFENRVGDAWLYKTKEEFNN